MRLGDLQRLVKELFGPRVMGEPVFGQAAIKQDPGPEFRRVDGRRRRFLQQVGRFRNLPLGEKHFCFKKAKLPVPLRVGIVFELPKAAVRQGEGLLQIASLPEQGCLTKNRIRVRRRASNTRRQQQQE